MAPGVAKGMAAKTAYWLTGPCRLGCFAAIGSAAVIGYEWGVWVHFAQTGLSELAICSMKPLTTIAFRWMPGLHTWTN